MLLGDALALGSIYFYFTQHTNETHFPCSWVKIHEEHKQQSPLKMPIFVSLALVIFNYFSIMTTFHFEGSEHGKKFLVTEFLFKRKSTMLFKSHKYSSQCLWVSFTMNEKADCSYRGKIYMCTKAFNLLQS